MFSLARQNAKTPRDLAAGMETVEACLRIIWECRKRGPLKWWALENPLGYLRQFLGRPPFMFQHWEFGDGRHCKPTDIWGYFTPPRKTVKTKPHTLFSNRNQYEGNWQKPPPPKGYEHLTDRAAIRSVTPPGFARAFFKANP